MATYKLWLRFLLLLQCLNNNNNAKGSSLLDTELGRVKTQERVDGTTNSSFDDVLAYHELNENHLPVGLHFIGDPNEPSRNDWICNPCVCFMSKKGTIVADCSGQTLLDIPQKLPDNIRTLNISRNYLMSFEIEKIMAYQYLSVVSLKSNSHLQQVKGSQARNRTSAVSKLDLSNCDINSIEPRSFLMMPMLLNLTLKTNRINIVSDLTFEGLGQLHFLDLSNNRIQSLQPGAFNHLKNLRTLDISYNPDLGYSAEHLPPSLFHNLQRLQQLYMHKNSNNGSEYPNEALGQLKDLQELRIDALGDDVFFGDEMRLLQKLTHLDMGTAGYCQLTRFNGYFFDNLPYLRSFKLGSCAGVTHIDPQAYSKLKAINLTTLSLTGLTQYDLFKVLKCDLKYLQYSSLKELSLVGLYYDQYPCRTLTAVHARYLQNIELETLDLSGNRLVAVTYKFTKALPQSINTLVLKKNKFTLTPLILANLVYMQNLRKLYISEQSADDSIHIQMESSTSAMSSQNISHGSPPVVPYCEAEPLVDENELIQESCLSSVSIWALHNVTEKFRLEGDMLDPHGISDVCHTLSDNPMPPKLRIIIAAKYNNFGKVIFSANLGHNISLKEVDFSQGLLSSVPIGVMPAGIEKADLSGNHCQLINISFFQPNNSLVHLDLHDNLLRDQIANDNGSFFAELSQVKYLDISQNYIYTLPGNVFRGLRSVELLNINRNKVMYLNTSFSYMSRLRHLDLSENAITSISKDVRDDFDTIATLHELSIDLSLNPLPCMCDELQVLHWMASTKVNLLNLHKIECRFDDGNVEDVGDIHERLTSLQRFCASKGIIITICLSCIILCTVIISFALMYRYRWKLRYLWNIAVAKMIGFKPKVTRSAGYKFDAYFIYTEDSRRFVLRDCIRELEEKRGHRICVEDRDFMPGTLAISGIVSAVQNSAKTVPVVTPDFYDEDYSSEYCVKMAIMEELYKERSVLHLCVYQPISEEQMTHCQDLLMLMKRNSYTEFPPEDETNEEVRLHFWDQLSQAIGHNSSDPDSPT